MDIEMPDSRCPSVSLHTGTVAMAMVTGSTILASAVILTAISVLRTVTFL